MLIAMLALSANAANEKKSVSQVTDAVALTTDIDYTITGETPFATTGSVDIQNTEHAVLIFQKVKPSKVIKNWMGKIYINGEKAADGVNCQVKMYNRGAIIMPYGKDFMPLTCYTESNFEGESYNNYTEGSYSGFMKSLTEKELNNNFKSFKLKRGYMVTFALGSSGWGYSRCFIADAEDLEMNLPTNMSGRVSSYRLFKWWDASKAGIHDTSAATNDALNTTSCFDWAQGNASLLPDVEWVPNHIYEDWPSASTCGSVTGSCHMKTNNEPGNSADDHPQDVETVLNNWQNLMRTGMRLCSESSHDGSMNHLKTFIEEIDKRGWRCDILDLHCYWQAGTFNNLTWYSDNYGNGRPIWISEWVWGASWNNNGIFAVGNRGDYEGNWSKNYDGTKPILEVLNANDRVERYFYWNSEANCSKIIKDGKMSTLGKYYSTMETGLAFKRKNEYVPKVVYNAPTDLAGTYNKTKGTFTLTWNDANGDMLDSLVVEVKKQGESKFTWLANVPLKDMNDKVVKYTFTDQPEAGATYYRVAAYPIGSKTAKYSDETSVTVGSSRGTDAYQYGKLFMTGTEAVATDYSEAFAETPAVFMGLCTNKNTKLYPGNLLTGVTNKKFTYAILPWAKQSNSETKLTATEEIPFLALKDNSNEKYGDLQTEVGVVEASKDTVEVKFRTPFPKGVTPVVIAEIRNASLKSRPISISTWDVTNEGFKLFIEYEEGFNLSISLDQNVCYFAITPGIAYLDEANDLIIAAGRCEEGLYGSTYRAQNFVNGEEQLYFKNPLLFGGLQTRNYHSATLLRRHGDKTSSDEGEHNGMVTGANVKRMVDTSSSTKDNKSSSDFADVFGWVVIAERAEGASVPSDPSAIIDAEAAANGSQLRVKVENGVISVLDDVPYSIYTMAGSKVNPKAAQPAGLYIVTSTGKHAAVVRVK